MLSLRNFILQLFYTPHFLLQYFTVSQLRSHFFLQLNGRLHRKHIFCGKCCFFTPFMPRFQVLFYR
jgi:hypothetical protein